MKVIEPGHKYELSCLDGDLEQILTFVAREPENGRVWPGTQTQDVLRCLIERTKYCDSCLRWEGNDLIIKHLRMALVLHEARALLRKTEKGIIKPESIIVGTDGHFALRDNSDSHLDEETRNQDTHIPHVGTFLAGFAGKHAGD